MLAIGKAKRFKITVKRPTKQTVIKTQTSANLFAYAGLPSPSILPTNPEAAN